MQTPGLKVEATNVKVVVRAGEKTVVGEVAGVSGIKGNSVIVKNAARVGDEEPRAACCTGSDCHDEIN